MRRIFKRFIAIVLAIMTVAAVMPVTAAAAENGNYKMVAITFDDGPSVYTPKLLDALKERGAKATFFVLGNRANKYSATIKRIIDEGHQLASHTYDHSNLARKSYSQILEQFNKTADILTALGGDGEYMVRLPYGSCDAEVREAAKTAGIPLINWSVDSLDWQYRNTTKIVNKVLKYTGDGAIILLHDIHSPTIPAAIKIIDRLMAKGYEFVTVEELLARRGITPQGGETYYNAPNIGVNLGPEVMSPEYYDEAKIQYHWGYNALKLSIDEGYINICENNAYKPNQYMTRAEFVEALGKLCKVNPEEYSATDKVSFGDVANGASYAPYVRWAVEKGIINGDGYGKFNPNANITRQETAACLRRFVKCYLQKDYIVIVPGESTEAAEPQLTDRELAAKKYLDADIIAEWALNAVLYCSESGLFDGCSDGTFAPFGNITRAQGATLLQRIQTLL